MMNVLVVMAPVGESSLFSSSQDVRPVISGAEKPVFATVVNLGRLVLGVKTRKFGRRRQAAERAYLTKTNVFSLE